MMDAMSWLANILQQVSMEIDNGVAKTQVPRLMGESDLAWALRVVANKIRLTP